MGLEFHHLYLSFFSSLYFTPTLTTSSTFSFFFFLFSFNFFYHRAWVGGVGGVGVLQSNDAFFTDDTVPLDSDGRVGCDYVGAEMDVG